jgi:hypothetical protein
MSKTGHIEIASRLVTVARSCFLGTKKRLYKKLHWSVRWSVGPLVGLSVPTMQLRGKLFTSRLLREEEKEEETDYVAIPSRLGIR